tara:strand:+ start:85 stop:342 length:258 start_codon:yes stop_codon:yes gene_type:complete
MKNLKFENLIFKKHTVVKDAVMASHKFKNGFEISVVGGGNGLYGNGKTSFEVAIFTPNGEFLNGDVKGWQSIEEINNLILEIQLF